MFAFQSDPELKKVVATTVSEIHGDCLPLQPAGCPSECPLHCDSLANLEKRLGIPATILALNDSLNHAQEYEKAAFWYDRFIRSIWVGADLSSVFGDFVAFLFEDKKVGISRRFRCEPYKDLVKKVLAAVREPHPDMTTLQELKSQLLEFDKTFADPTRMTSEFEPAILLIDFIAHPNKLLGSEMLMCCAAQFQYGKRGRSWDHLAKTYAEKYLDLLMQAPVPGEVHQ